MSAKNNKHKLRIDLSNLNNTVIERTTTTEIPQQATTPLSLAVSVVSSLYLSLLSQVWTTVIYANESASQTWLSWLRIDEKLHEVWIDGQQVKLPKKEYKLVVCLQKRAGKVCTREELISEVWPEVCDASGVSDAAIDQLVHRLRLKIEVNPSVPKRLINRRGFGYMLV
jgi:DNA-binding response OmpR family regulator